MKGKTKRLIAIAVVGIMLLTVFGSAAAFADTTVLYQKSEKQDITAGLTYEKSTRLYKSGWLDVYVLTMDASNTDLSLEVLEDVNTYGAKSTVEKLAKDNGVIAAVNGDFFGSGSLKSSMGNVAEDGRVVATQNYYNWNNWQYAGIYVDSAGTPFIDYIKSTLSVVNAANVTLTLGAKNKVTDFSKPVYFDRSAITSTAAIDAKYSSLVKMVVSNGGITYVSQPGETVQVPENGFIIVMNTSSRDYYLPYYNVGTAVSFYENEDFYIRPQKNISDIVFGMSGGGEVLRNGEIVQYGYTVSPSTNQPRTLIGVNKEKSKIYLVCIDGRKNGKGATNYECGAILKEYGVYDAIQMDGGGSTTMAVQKNGDSTVSVVNVPSEGTQRAVANGIGIKANGPAGTPVMVTASVADSEDNIMFNGFASTINAAVYDGQLNKMNVTPQYSSSLKGTWSGSTFTPTETGNGTVTVTYGDISKTIDVTVLKGVAALRAEAYSYALVTGQKTALTAKAINPEGYSLDIAQSDVTWSVDDSGVGHIDNGSFVADKDGLCTVTAKSEKYGVTGTLQINVGKKYVAINSFEGPRNIVNTYYPSSDSGISGGGAIDSTVSKDGRSSLRIDYSFKPDTVTTQCVYASLEKNEILFPSGVSDFEIWYKGDGSGNALKAVINYGSGQSADVTIADKMTGTDWKQAKVSLPSGAADNVRLGKVYVASYGTDGTSVKGSVYVDYITAQAVVGDAGGPASASATDYMAADLDKLTGSYTAISSAAPTQNTYSNNTSGNFTVLTLGVTNGSLTKNNEKQWSYISEVMSASYTAKNLVIKMNVSPWSGITDVKERTALHDLLKTAGRKYGKNVVVLFPNGKNGVEIKDGVRYIAVASSSGIDFKGDSENMYYEFR